MARKPKTYLRLPGRGRGIAHYARLWQGPDHVLLVISTGMSENYKRFYYRDIQAFVVRRTTAHHAVSAALAVFTLGFAVLTLGYRGGAWMWVWGIVAGIFALSLLINLLLGPTCVCHLRTAVQTERLTPLNRLRTARKALNRIRPLIVASQESPVSTPPVAAPVTGAI
jgi:hypothetical protein